MRGDGCESSSLPAPLGCALLPSRAVLHSQGKFLLAQVAQSPIPPGPGHFQ